MRDIADTMFMLVISAGMPAAIAMLWRIGSKVQGLSMNVKTLTDRVDRLEAKHATHHERAHS